MQMMLMPSSSSSLSSCPATIILFILALITTAKSAFVSFHHHQCASASKSRSLTNRNNYRNVASASSDARTITSSYVLAATLASQASEFQPLNGILETISDESANDAAQRMKLITVPVSTYVSDSGSVDISYIHWVGKARKASSPLLPLLLVHGFDSSALEFRRLGPQLAELGIDVYCVDLLGWGFTQLDSNRIKSFSARAKIEALEGFWQTVGRNRQVIVGGASLGGAAAIEFAVRNLYPSRFGINGDDTNNTDKKEGFVRGTVLIDAQVFVDGIGPMSALPGPLARAGIKVLQSVPLRNYANQMSYYNPQKYATEDALNIGRAHCVREGWENAMLSFMQSGGFRPRDKIAKIDVPTLVLWGLQDGILDGAEYGPKLTEILPDVQWNWIEECGHVPHLEQPEVTAQYISEFVCLEKMKPFMVSKQGNSLNVFEKFFQLLQ